MRDETRTVVLIRHAIAEESRPGLEDFDRRLTPDGARRMRRAANGLERLIGPIDAIWSSPATRCLETALILAAAWEMRHTVRTNPDFLPEVPVETAARHLTESASGRTLVVSHEPLLSSLAAHFTGVPPSSVRFRKGGCWAFDLSLDGKASVRFVIPPSILRRAARP